jgi:hypothetical protein
LNGHKVLQQFKKANHLRDLQLFEADSKKPTLPPQPEGTHPIVQTARSLRSTHLFEADSKKVNRKDNYPDSADSTADVLSKKPEC